MMPVFTKKTLKIKYILRFLSLLSRYHLILIHFRERKWMEIDHAQVMSKENQREPVSKFGNSSTPIGKRPGAGTNSIFRESIWLVNILRNQGGPLKKKNGAGIGSWLTFAHLQWFTTRVYITTVGVYMLAFPFLCKNYSRSNHLNLV